jgi:hypothetical protein
MQKKLLLFALLFHCLFSLAIAEENYDFMIRIFDTKGGERTSGTISVRIVDLKEHDTKLGQTFTQTYKNNDISTGIEIEWLGSKSGVDIFKGVIHQSDGNVSQIGIKIEFPYENKSKIIHSNQFHTIKIIPKEEA